QPLTLPVNAGATENILVITADGKGIVMHPDGLREATRKASEKAVGKMQTRLSPGEKGHRKRMATVVSVYEIAPYFRTPAQILDPEENTDNQRPKPCRKRTWARVEDDLAAVIEQGFLEAIRRDPDQQMRWVVLTDGQDDLLRQVHAVAKRYKVEVTLVQDFIHVIEYLWKAAHALHPDNPEDREAWVLDRAKAILEGHATDVAVGLRRAATRKQLNQQAPVIHHTYCLVPE
ncbi:MAG: ISKra4 family transposase, partial [Methylococcales bacterium]|nr:ISKra4 family transposase [Methylococcales bacterium]